MVIISSGFLHQNTNPSLQRILRRPWLVDLVSSQNESSNSRNERNNMNKIPKKSCHFLFQLPLCLIVRKNFNRCFTPCLPILWEDSKLKTINLHSLVRQCFTTFLPTITAFQFVALSDVLMALMTLPMLLTEIVVSKSILGIGSGDFSGTRTGDFPIPCRMQLWW